MRCKQMMTMGVALLAGMFLAACGGGGGADAAPAPAVPAPAPAAAAPPAVSVDLHSPGWSVAGMLLNSGYVVESELVPNGDGFDIFHQRPGNTLGRIERADQNGLDVSAGPVLPDVCRFPTFYTRAGIQRLACIKDHGSGDVYEWERSDMRTWTVSNSGQPIVRQAASGPWSWLANVTVIELEGRLHMYAEVSGGIAYAWADATAPVIDFTPNQGPVILPGAGNPQVLAKAGKLIMVHGIFRNAERFAGAWYTTMSEADPADPTAWTTREDKLLIGQGPGSNGAPVDVCDPSYIEVGGVAYLTVSWGQDRVVVLRGVGL